MDPSVHPVKVSGAAEDREAPENGPISGTGPEAARPARIEPAYTQPARRSPDSPSQPREYPTLGYE